MERRALDDLRRRRLEDDPLATRLQLAIASAQRSLASIEKSDPQKTMSPIRTGIPDARRAVEAADTLIRALCQRPRT